VRAFRCRQRNRASRDANRNAPQTVMRRAIGLAISLRARLVPREVMIVLVFVVGDFTVLARRIISLLGVPSLALVVTACGGGGSSGGNVASAVP